MSIIIKCKSNRNFGFAMKYKCYKNEGHDGRCEYYQHIMAYGDYVEIRASWRKRDA